MTMWMCTPTLLLASCKHCCCLPSVVHYRLWGTLTNSYLVETKRKKKKKKEILVIETGLCLYWVLTLKRWKDRHSVLSYYAVGLFCISWASFTPRRFLNSAAVFSSCWMFHCQFLLFNWILFTWQCKRLRIASYLFRCTCWKTVHTNSAWEEVLTDALTPLEGSTQLEIINTNKNYVKYSTYY